MAGLQDYKIVGNTELSGSANELRVGSQPTVLRGTAAQNKQAFDNYCDLIATLHNGLCDYLETGLSPTIDRSVLELYQSLGWIPEN